ncbi:60S ribosomal protein L27-like [Perognathus longimembris pacificus]|uniref:60S ribosomal protein L27-like n=1 Tax=Perognathus longimembris pacificus TaxID=214514 RepID=UPI002019E84E|nr:60S ribosomal protein L27-like [Perognathus longimembris pacificus]
MSKFTKPVVVLAGSYFRGKTILVKTINDGASDRPYNHALVSGIDRCPPKVTAYMGKQKITKRSKIKCSLDISMVKTVVNKNVFRDPALKLKAQRGGQGQV